MPLYTFLHNLLNALVQIANKMGVQEKYSRAFSDRSEAKSKTPDVHLYAIILDPRASAELVPKFHVALHASHADFPMVTLRFSPNVALLMSD
jgi:hypothetical protein